MNKAMLKALPKGNAHGNATGDAKVNAQGNAKGNAEGNVVPGTRLWSAPGNPRSEGHRQGTRDPGNIATRIPHCISNESKNP